MKQILDTSQSESDNVFWWPDINKESTINQSNNGSSNLNLTPPQSPRLKSKSAGLIHRNSRSSRSPLHNRELGRRLRSPLNNQELGRMSPLHLPKCHLSTKPSSPANVNVIYIGGDKNSGFVDRSNTNTNGRTSPVQDEFKFKQIRAPLVKTPSRPPLPPPQIVQHPVVENKTVTQSLNRAGRKIQRSLALTSFRKDKNTYVALPTIEALCQNVMVSPKSKKILQLPSLKHPKQSIDAYGDEFFNLLPLHQRTRSYDELNIYKGVITNNSNYNNNLMPSRSYDNILYENKSTHEHSQDDLSYKSEDDLVNMRSAPNTPHANPDRSATLRNAALYQNGIRRTPSYFPKEKDPYVVEEKSQHLCFESQTQDKVRLRRPPGCTNVLPRAKL
ncbi:unnamed protein product, partial [Meganyctiphanes norvegica]